MNKYVVITAPHQIALRERPVPQPKQGEALLKILYGGICGSDLGSYRGSFAYTNYPCVPGHEFSAEIAEIAPNDSGLAKGMIVTANPYFNCGRCYSCRRSLVNCCMSNQTMGVQREGAFSQYITIPVAHIYDGNGLDAKTLALIEPFCIGYHAVRRANVQPDEKVLVIGAGTIGILAAVAAKQLGGRVYICDISESRLNHAERFGLDGVFFNASPNELRHKVDSITGGDGFDIAIEAAGLPSTFQDCVDSAAFAGNVIVLGVSRQTIDFDYTIIQKKELNIHGSRNALKQDFERVIELVKSGKVDLLKLITNEYDIDDAARAFHDLDKHAGERLKVMIKF